MMGDHWRRAVYGAGIVWSVIGLMEHEMLWWASGAILLAFGSFRRGDER